MNCAIPLEDSPSDTDAAETLARVQQILTTVTDPEIPTLSVVEMGIVSRIQLIGSAVVIDMTPTFAGCPALDVIRRNISAALKAGGFQFVNVNVVFDPPWSSDQITEEGRRKLKAFGLAPPKQACSEITELQIAAVSCPFCDSENTTLESIFGPTLCRAIHYCNACRQSFEQFKPI